VLREIELAGDACASRCSTSARHHVDEAATRMLAALVASGAARDRRIVLTRVRRGEMLASFGSVLDPRHAQSVIFQPQLDAGLEWCERTLIARGATIPAAPPIHNLAEHRWCSGVAPTDLVYLQAYMDWRKYEAGADRAAGDVADRLYFLLAAK
jgi:glutaminase